MLGVLFTICINALTIIAPKAHKNHRLTFKNGPKIINSSVNERTRPDDYFEINEDYTLLTNVRGNNTMCQKKDKSLITCPKSIKSLMFKIQDVEREVRFKNSANECLTLGRYKKEDDSYEVNLESCEEKNINQIFILFKDHGLVTENAITRKNITETPNDKIEDYKKKEKPFEMIYERP